MISVSIDNKTTIEQVIQSIEQEFNMIFDHIEYTAQYHNFTGDIDKQLNRIVADLKKENESKIQDIVKPDLDFCFETESQDDLDSQEYPVYILSLEFTWDNNKIPNIDNARKTGKSLQYAIDNPAQFTGFEKYLEDSIEYQIKSTLDMIWSEFSWIDYYNLPILEQSNNEEKEEFHPALLVDGEDIIFTHVMGHYQPKKPGDRKVNNDKMVFVGTLPGIGHEIEEQAENGKCAYHYIGENFFEVWIHERFVDWAKIEEK
jgi:hypothetical protein